MDNLGRSVFVCDDDMNFDFHLNMEWSSTENERSVAIDDNRFTVTNQWLVGALSRNCKSQGNTSASAHSGITPL